MPAPALSLFMHKDLHQLLRPLIKGGYSLRPAGKHATLRDPAGHIVRVGQRPLVVPLSPSDWRAMKNLRAQLKRAGLLH